MFKTINNRKLLVLFTVIFQVICISKSGPALPPDNNNLEYIEKKVEEDIKEEKYNDAESLLSGLTASQIKDVIHVVFLQVGFGGIYKLILMSSHISVIYALLTQLASETESLKNKPSYLIDNCEIYQALTQKIIDSNDQGKDQEIIENARETLNEIRPKIVNEAAPKIKEHVLANTFSQAKDLIETVFHANESVFDETICKVIDEVYNDIRFRNLVETMWTLKFASQKATAFVCIFQKLNRNLNNNLQAADILGDYLKRLKALSTFPYLSEQKAKQIDEVIDQLPKSVKDKYFKSTN